MTRHRPLNTVRMALFGFALLLGPAAPAIAQNAAAPAPVLRAEGQGPAMWVVRDADSTLYLFGSMHLLRPDTRWGSERLDRALESASRLILEVVTPTNQTVLGPLIRQYGVSPDRPLSSLLTAEEIAVLDAAARTVGATAADLDPMRPWLAGVTVQSASILKQGYAAEAGVETVLKARAEAAGMPVSGFETPEDQIRMLSGFPEEGQVAYLRRSLQEFGAQQTELDRLVTAWSTGDVETLRIVSVEPLRANSDLLYQALLVRRNTNWADQIETLLEGSGDIFIAVGAMHLAGDDSVQEILRARGVSVERVP